MAVGEEKIDCMKICIDARLYSESGVGRYIRNLLLHLSKIDKKNKYFILLLKKDFDKLVLPENFERVVADIHWYGLAEQTEVPKIIKKLKVDLVHFPHFNVPFFYNLPFIVTIHDLIHQKFQMRRATTLNPLIYFVKHNAYKQVFEHAVRKSRKVITVSDYVKKELVQNYKLKTDKILVTKEAVEDGVIEYSQNIKDADIKGVLDKFNIKRPYIFYVGNAHPHKNVEMLIKAFINLRKEYQYLQLVLSGNNHYFWDRLKQVYKLNDVIFTGFVSDPELVSLYKGAKFFTSASLEEGFGIPILEAMACKTPVVCSNRGSLPEVGGDACVYFDPTDMEDMVAKMSEVLNDHKLREALIRKGEERVKEFSWEKLARETLEVYEAS